MAISNAILENALRSDPRAKKQSFYNRMRTIKEGEVFIEKRADQEAATKRQKSDNTLLISTSDNTFEKIDNKPITKCEQTNSQLVTNWKQIDNKPTTAASDNIFEKTDNKPITKREQANNKLVTNRQQSDNNLVIATSDNIFEKTDNKPITKREQANNKLVTNRQQSDNNSVIATSDKILEKNDNKPITNWQQTDNKKEITNQQENSYKSNLKNQFNNYASLVGLQRLILLTIYQNCKNSPTHNTESLTLEFIAKSIYENEEILKKTLKKTTNIIKTNLQRLEKKNCLIRVEYKNGRGGWSKYQLPMNVYNEIGNLEIHLNCKQSDNKLATK
jgi:hypothetical protein